MLLNLKNYILLINFYHEQEEQYDKITYKSLIIKSNY